MGKCNNLFTLSRTIVTQIKSEPKCTNVIWGIWHSIEGSIIKPKVTAVLTFPNQFEFPLYDGCYIYKNEGTTFLSLLVGLLLCMIRLHVTVFTYVS